MAPNGYHHPIGISRRRDKEKPMERLDRITQQAEVMGGKACIRGMRVTVGMVVSQIGTGHSIDEILADYPYLEREDILQALRYAAWRAEEREVVLARMGLENRSTP
jgi:uncharacterized protein (DUF433 family)